MPLLADIPTPAHLTPDLHHHLVSYAGRASGSRIFSPRDPWKVGWAISPATPSAWPSPSDCPPRHTRHTPPPPRLVTSRLLAKAGFLRNQSCSTRPAFRIPLRILQLRWISRQDTLLSQTFGFNTTGIVYVRAGATEDCQGMAMMSQSTTLRPIVDQSRTYSSCWTYCRRSSRRPLSVIHEGLLDESISAVSLPDRRHLTIATFRLIFLDQA